MTNRKKEIPEVDIVVDEEKGVIREVKSEEHLRSKKAHEKHINNTIHTVLVIISIVWLCPFVFLVLQSFRSYLTESGGMVDYVIPHHFSLDNYRDMMKAIGDEVLEAMLQQRLAVEGNQSLGFVLRQGFEAGAQASGQYHGGGVVLHALCSSVILRSMWFSFRWMSG